MSWYSRNKGDIKDSKFKKNYNFLNNSRTKFKEFN